MKAEISEATPLILASTSPYRAELLKRLRLPFEAVPSKVDETPLPLETPLHLAQRLAAAKAQIVAHAKPGRWVLGSDQVASLDGQPVGKPGGREAAIGQLMSFSNRTVQFHTAVALECGDQAFSAVDTTLVRFRALRPAEIQHYVDAEPAFDCAGSFKVEGLGIALFSAVESKDPTALIGLPLIAVRQLLAQAGHLIP